MQRIDVGYVLKFAAACGFADVLGCAVSQGLNSGSRLLTAGRDQTAAINNE